MTLSAVSPSTTLRCQHHSRTGRRCRKPVVNHDLGLCASHSESHPSHRSLADFSRALTRDAQHFQTAVGIHTSLSSLYKLLAKDRIPARRAAVLAYISSLQIRVLPLALAEINPHRNDAPIRVDVEFPRPDPLPPSLVESGQLA